MSSPATVVSDRAATSATALWAKILVSLPDRIVIWAMCAMLATALTVIPGIFHPYTLFPVFLVLVAASWKLTPRALKASRAQLIATALVLVGTVVWILLQRPYFGQLLSVRRDAAVYTLRGVWLMNHPSPNVQLTNQLLYIHFAVPEANLDFGVETWRLTRYFQSTTVVPGLIAAVGWVGGYVRLLQANLLIGGTALIAVFAVARRMAGPLFGLLPFVAMALSVPMAAFSRVPFTEPVSMISVMVCLLGLWQGARGGGRAMWLLAGAGAGGVAIARIDGALVVIGAVVGLGLWGAFAVTRAGRRRALAALGWFCLTALPIGGLGLIDLVVNSPDYLHVLAPSARPLLVAVPAVIVLAVLVAVLPGVPIVARFVAGRSQRVAVIAAGVVSLVMVAMILRPLYFTAHGTGDAATQYVIKAKQNAQGLPVDPSRSYDEQSINWLAWYHGWLAVLLGCAAVALAVFVAIRYRRLPIVLVTSVLAVNAALYLVNVSITPDQIWAMRRFLPVIEPGGLLMLAWGLNQAWRARSKISDRLARFSPGLSSASRTRLTGAVLAVLAALCGVWPATTWGSLFRVPEGTGQLNMVEQVCGVIGNQKVLILGNIPVMGFYQPTFRNFCGSTVITMPANADPARIAKVVSLWGGGPVYAVSFYPTGVPWTTTPAHPDFSDTYQMWESVVSRRVANPVGERTDIYLGMVGADGRVTPR